MNKLELRRLAGPYQKTGVLLDANLLLVLIIGSVNPGLVRTFHRTKNDYEPDDWALLSAFVKSFPRLRMTPNVLTEASNLLGNGKGILHQQIFQAFRNFIPEFDERYVASQPASQENCFTDLGLTDAALFSLARDGVLILTNDGPLYQWLTSERLSCLSLDHLWEAATRPQL